jgi:PTS system glucose-specific IIA component
MTDPVASSDGDTLAVLAPVTGAVLPLAEVPDAVFAEAIVGPGVALDPERRPLAAVAPVTGRIVKLHPHAFVVLTGTGRAVLTHLGIDTVQLKGEGFERLLAEGDEVTVGTPVIAWDPAAVEASGRSPICPVIALDAAAGAISLSAVGERVDAGAKLFRWT